MDRMLGPLVRYLRFMGYDTLAATELGPGGPHEDSELLRRASAEGRVLLTRDRELASRGGVLVPGDDVLEQVAALARSGLVEPVLRLDRCSRCNTLLRHASASEIAVSPYAPSNPGDSEFFWCDSCGRLYWFGSHGEDLAARLRTVGTGTGSQLRKYLI
ncbi:MAG: Mut7-C RNAse domain-containing protein [Methanospirillum sp.]